MGKGIDLLRMPQRLWCWYWFFFWSHSLLTSFPSNISRLYERLFYWWCCSLEILYVSFPIFWWPGMVHCSITIFVFLRKYVFTTTTQGQHFLIFFTLYQGLDGVGCLQGTISLEALYAFLHFLHSLKWLCHSGRRDPQHVYSLLTGLHPGETRFWQFFFWHKFSDFKGLGRGYMIFHI